MLSMYVDGTMLRYMFRIYYSPIYMQYYLTWIGIQVRVNTLTCIQIWFKVILVSMCSRAYDETDLGVSTHTIRRHDQYEPDWINNGRQKAKKRNLSTIFERCIRFLVHTKTFFVKCMSTYVTVTSTCIPEQIDILGIDFPHKICLLICQYKELSLCVLLNGYTRESARSSVVV